ncbi:Leucyl/phenylalanyl-tRNA--protein transferase [Mariniflexile rhizosphaerae]|uniref:leucyl/phenylalanyl-tRNA--protein transferase n=1 Tax=unclassified Mariniflexile TaxID=2643887 RepID=UPI000CAF9208|nr:leucyl/phenylalanyl-tRNA--protein transferase [Mariniflexile sp. TRM1-10]AXP80286.1 Leucyl/phenylalanyl-tRNA--protein transferase [Mariniflexile sp. TRM1-10]PLB17979.1 MAG: Leucyl/phenylalanyl-tRNA-protein transferase [Flavobacteriaceae bacterium FS1-H7996/R]
MHYLTQDIKFPDVTEASPDGLLAIGGDLSEARLIQAYKQGIFPWFNEGEPLLWWSPNPRFVLFPEKLKVSKSMKQVLKNKGYVVTVNKDFRAVITACSKAKRDGQAGTWITNDMIEAYVKLHDLGYAKSVEVWDKDKLIGGFYGIDLNNGVFCGESMFAKISNASKVAFITFIQNTHYKLIDCQVYTNHLESLGAENISRDLFLEYLSL